MSARRRASNPGAALIVAGCCLFACTDRAGEAEGSIGGASGSGTRIAGAATSGVDVGGAGATPNAVDPIDSAAGAPTDSDGSVPRQDSSAPQEIHFGVLADPQYCDCNAAGSRYYRESLWKLDTAMGAFSTQEVAFTILVGDLIDRDFASYATIRPRYEDKAPGEQYYVLGNHEWSVADADKTRVRATLGLNTNPYYSFSRGGYRFVVLDGSELSLYATESGSPERLAAEQLLADLQQDGASNAKDWNGAVSAAQLDWLSNELDGAAAQQQRVLVFCHFPVYPPQATHNLYNDAQVRRLLESHADIVAAYVAGHNHAGEYDLHEGINYLTLHGMVETVDQNSYAIIHAYGDHLDIEGFGRQPSCSFPLP